MTTADTPASPRATSLIDVVKSWLFFSADENTASLDDSIYLPHSEQEEAQDASQVQHKPPASTFSRKRKRRPRTTYYLGYPPPRAKTQSALSRKTRLILQLQEVSPTGRTIPAFDIVPAIALASRVERASSSLIKRRSRPGAADLAVLRAEAYQCSTDSPSSLDHENDNARDARAAEDDSLSLRDMYGILRHDFKAVAWIITLYDGTMWTCKRLDNGNYSFANAGVEASLDPLIPPIVGAQWIHRRRRRNQQAADEPRRFRFCPRYEGQSWAPFAGMLRKDQLAVFDSYRVELWPSITPETENAVSEGDDFEDMDMASHSPSFGKMTPLRLSAMRTTDQLRALATISGIWVAAQEGWLTNVPRVDDHSTSDQCRGSSLLAQTMSSTAPMIPSPRQGSFTSGSGSSNHNDVRPKRVSSLVTTRQSWAPAEALNRPECGWTGSMPLFPAMQVAQANTLSSSQMPGKQDLEPAVQRSQIAGEADFEAREELLPPPRAKARLFAKGHVRHPSRFARKSKPRPSSRHLDGDKDSGVRTPSSPRRVRSWFSRGLASFKVIFHKKPFRRGRAGAKGS